MNVTTDEDLSGLNLTLNRIEPGSALFSTHKSGQDINFSLTGSNSATRTIKTSQGSMLTAQYVEGNKKNRVFWGDPDLAYGKQAFASGSQGSNLPANALDGATTTQWLSNASNGEWVYVDLLRNFDISMARLIWGAGYPTQYKVQAALSVDANGVGNWIDLTSETAGHSGETVYPYNMSTSARYIRVLCQNFGAPYHWNFSAPGFNQLKIILPDSR